MFSEITKKRIAYFKSIRRSYYSFWLLSLLFVLSLFSEFIANEKPIYVFYQNKSFFPIWNFYPGTNFGQKQKTVANYLKLKMDKNFLENSFVIWPLYSSGPFHSYLDKNIVPPHLPSKDHWLGTDRLGRDILARLLYGFRIGMLFSLCLTFIMAILGVLIGGIQGYLGGKFDLICQRFIEIWSTLPFLYVVILLASLYGRSFSLLIFVIALFNWIGLSYYMRAEFLKTKKQNYILAAKALGFSNVRIFFSHILPNTLTPLVSILPFSIINGLGTLTALDFLGFGLQAPTPSWGELLQQGLGVIREFPHLSIITILVFFITLLLATLIGEGVRDSLDPQKK